MEDATLHELASLLLRLERVIGNQQLREEDPGEHRNQLQEAFQRLDAKVRDLQGGLHPRLEHFLTQRSYAKALDWIRMNAPQIPEDESAN